MIAAIDNRQLADLVGPHEFEGGPNPAAEPNIWSLASATAVGPTPAPSATFRKKLTDMASPRERFGTTSKIAEKPQAVTMPDNAK